MQLDAPSLRARIIAACVFSVLIGSYTSYVLRGRTMQAVDFTYPWLAGRALTQGLDPYEYVAKSLTPFTPTLFYPAPVGLIVAPIAWLSASTAATIFMAVGAGCLAFAVTAKSMWRLMIFASAPMHQACVSVQWSPLLLAAALWWPALGLVIVKPNIALPLLAMQTTRRAILAAVIGGIVLVLVSLAIVPAWPLHWYQTVRNAPVVSQYKIPVLTLWGACVALAALRWRRPEARLLLGLACSPQNFFFYDQLPLFLVPTSRRQMVIAVWCSWIGYEGWQLFAYHAHAGTVSDSASIYPYTVASLYLPALIMVLLRSNRYKEERPRPRQSPK